MCGQIDLPHFATGVPSIENRRTKERRFSLLETEWKKIRGRPGDSPAPSQHFVHMLSCKKGIMQGAVGAGTEMGEVSLPHLLQHSMN
jgi:hypothetical protein